MRSVFLKARLENEAHVKEILMFLGGKFLGTDEMHYEYVQLDKETVLFLRTDSRGKTYLFTVRTADKKFEQVDKIPVDDKEHAHKELKAKRKPIVSFSKRKSVYALKGIEISFSTIDGIGTFLELETSQYDYPELKHYAKKFGLSDRDIVLTPYNQLVLNAKKKKSRKTLSIKR